MESNNPKPGRRETYRERRLRRQEKRERREQPGIIKLVIPGDPIAQKRGRATIRGKHAGIHSTQQKETADFKVRALEQYFGKPLEGALDVKFEFYLRRPKSHYGTGRNAGRLKPSAPKYHITTPDASNLLKFAEDCLNKILWKDDALIVHPDPWKFYADGGPPRTEITVTVLT